MYTNPPCSLIQTHKRPNKWEFTAHSWQCLAYLTADSELMHKPLHMFSDYGNVFSEADLTDHYSQELVTLKHTLTTSCWSLTQLALTTADPSTKQLSLLNSRLSPGEGSQLPLAVCTPSQDHRGSVWCHPLFRASVCLHQQANSARKSPAGQ